MKLDELIKELQKLQAEGKGNWFVYVFDEYEQKDEPGVEICIDDEENQIQLN